MNANEQLPSFFALCRRGVQICLLFQRYSLIISCVFRHFGNTCKRPMYHARRDDRLGSPDTHLVVDFCSEGPGALSPSVSTGCVFVGTIGGTINDIMSRLVPQLMSIEGV